MSGPQGFIVHAIEFFLIQNIQSNAINCLDLLIQSAFKIKQADQKKESISYEVLYGVSGFLYVLNYDLLNDKIIAQDFRLIYYFHDKEYIGGAHGLFGVLNIMMQSILLLNQQFLALPKSKYILKSIELSLNFLLSYQQKNGNFLSSFNSKKSGNNSLCQFCHGSPGAVSPLILASELFKNQKYLNAALQCGQNVWEQGLLKKGFGLCHGISGNGYAFLSLYKATNNQEWMNKAKLFGQIWEIKQYMDYINNYELEDRYVVGKPDYPFSMFQGIVGDILYLIDLQQPKQFQFLGYTL
ncbi:hypothetical protein PPERSA_06806 [Pseudocohnilembus persalinus]|uniref:Terpenoid cyclases/protein prenyltransferase alpha-alpha toroid n=1 Tax=Pseudocohnilembus persalinus TaxID=266149 RepID=A0A0V0QSH5_PSEPJ|nr:hypothetical protein PPERSA_06806 [Pseudocohnilembus persalinus]|eukprot:KRX05172.1 hypothetical protein PPERSA_06806 [Pseudocohnilembus persalinus]